MFFVLKSRIKPLIKKAREHENRKVSTFYEKKIEALKKQYELEIKKLNKKHNKLIAQLIEKFKEKYNHIVNICRKYKRQHLLDKKAYEIYKEDLVKNRANKQETKELVNRAVMVVGDLYKMFFKYNDELDRLEERNTKADKKVCNLFEKGEKIVNITDKYKQKDLNIITKQGVAK